MKRRIGRSVKLDLSLPHQRSVSGDAPPPRPKTSARACLEPLRGRRLISPEHSQSSGAGRLSDVHPRDAPSSF